MAMSDCPKCWSTPCECGHKYESWSAEKLASQISMLQRVLDAKRTSHALASESIPNRLYVLAKQLYPKGLYGEDFLSMEVESQTVQLRCFVCHHGGTDVEFALFPVGGRYPRKRIAVWADGRVDDARNQYVPPSDKVEKEVKFRQSAQEILQTILTHLEAVSGTKQSPASGPLK